MTISNSRKNCRSNSKLFAKLISLFIRNLDHFRFFYRKLQQKKSSKRRTSVGSGGEKEDSSSRSNSPKLGNNRYSSFIFISIKIFHRVLISSVSARRSIAAIPTKSTTPIAIPKFDKQDSILRKKKEIVYIPVSLYEQLINVWRLQFQYLFIF